MKKDIWIVVIVLCVLGIASVFYKVWKDGRDGLLDKFSNYEYFGNRNIVGNKDIVETYTNPVLQNNLIYNGSFNEGKPPAQFSGSHGNNEIIVFPNNGQSSYVLRQSSLKTLPSTDPIYYRIDLALKPNSIYYLGCLYFSTKNVPLRVLVIFNKASKILLKTEEESKYQYAKSGDFKARYTLFKTPIDNEEIKTSIYLSYNLNSMAGFNYITDIGMFELLNNNVIPVWDDLRSYFNPYNTESIEPGYPDLRDLSFHGFDFRSKLATNVEKGKIVLTENMLTGPNAFKLQNSGMINLTNNFTMFIYAKGENLAVKKEGNIVETFASAEDESQDPSKMTLAQYQKLWNNTGCTSILSENSLSWWKTQTYANVVSDMKNYYQLASQCKGTDKQNSICLPGKCPKTGTTGTASQSELAMSEALLRQPASVKSFISLSELNKAINDIDGIQLITFPGNQSIAVSIIVPKKYGPIRVVIGGTIYETTISQPNFMDLLFAVVYNGDNIILYLNGEPILETICPKIYYDNNPVMINPDAKFVGNLFAFAYYNRVLTPQQVGKVSSYFVKMRAVGEEITVTSAKAMEKVNSFLITDGGVTEEEGLKSMKKYANLSPEERKKMMVLEEQQIILKRSIESKCPKVVFEDGHYYVIIQPGSNLAKDLGYSGLRDYGTNIDTAKQIFETNFPSCAIPDILDKKKYKGELEECPFVVINEDNPCKKFECKGTDWKKGTSNDPTCKKAIDTYCTKYAGVDNACYCWRPENSNKPECLKWRGQFDNPDRCDFRKYPIDKHPDSDKWIRKDKIPCWGCNLTAPETSGNYSCRKGSGGR